MKLPADRLVLASLACLAGAILVCVLALLWLTPITGLVCFFVGTPLLVAGIGGYLVALLRGLSGPAGS